MARKVVQMRNENRMSYYPPDKQAAIRARNLEKYGNELGPTYETQLSKYGHPEAVIEAAYRTNNTMDVLTGIAEVRN
jgi:hypothetical protein